MGDDVPPRQERRSRSERLCGAEAYLLVVISSLRESDWNSLRGRDAQQKRAYRLS